MLNEPYDDIVLLMFVLVVAGKFFLVVLIYDFLISQFFVHSVICSHHRHSNKSFVFFPTGNHLMNEACKIKALTEIYGQLN